MAEVLVLMESWENPEINLLSLITILNLFSRFRVLFVHLIPCVSLVILNILLFRTMKEAEKKRERLLNCRQKISAKGESKESKKLRDSNCTTLMLIVVITVSK